MTVTAAEAVGFLAPTLAGVLTARAGVEGAPQAAAVVAGGLVEGLVLGAGQSWALPLAVRRTRFALLTSLGAGVVWAGVMAAMQLHPLVGIAAAFVGLGAIGSAQWVELRHHAKRAWRWIAWTAAAWALALPLSFLPGPFVDERTPFGTQLLVWGGGGLLMALVMAIVTWQGVRRLAP